MADVRRAEETFRLLAYEILLRAGRCRAPEAEDAVAVMIVDIHHDRLLAANEPRRRAVTQALSDFGQREANVAQPIERCRPRHAQAGVPKINRYPLTSR